MFKAGILDPTKVVKTALTNAASIAGLMLTTEALVTNFDQERRQEGRRRQHPLTAIEHSRLTASQRATSPSAASGPLA